MNEKYLKGIRCVSSWMSPVFNTERRIVKRLMPAVIRGAACLLLIGVLLPATFCFAQQQDPREAAIVADLAAGKDIAVIIQNAVAAGLSVSRAVDVLVTAGADQGRVVYAAITAGFDASSVIQGAAAALLRMGLSDSALLSQLATIVSVARQAGASEAAVNNGLSNAGVSPTMIANADARAATSPAPVFGYTAPAGPSGSLTSGIGGGGGGGLIGGSGIGAPPTNASGGTKKASPTKP